MIVLKYQDSTTENSLKTLGETYLFGAGGPTNFQNKKVPVQIWRIHQICISCFLIDMKFKSNPVCCLVMEIVSFFNPHLHKNIVKNDFDKHHKDFQINGGHAFRKFRKIELPDAQI